MATKRGYVNMSEMACPYDVEWCDRDRHWCSECWADATDVAYERWRDKRDEEHDND